MTPCRKRSRQVRHATALDKERDEVIYAGIVVIGGVLADSPFDQADIKLPAESAE
jgi:hypothetical protein